MDTMTLLPQGRPLTRDDLDAMPDDGHRYEIIDGVLVVTPAPSTGHQDLVRQLFLVLSAACPDELEVYFAPLEVMLSEDTVIEPDLLVARSDEFTGRGLPGAPLLAVEVLSPGTRRIDLVVKRSRLEAAGVPSYWVVDPEEPTLTVWELVEGHYVEVAHVACQEEYAATSPFPVTIVPARLRRHRP